MSPATFKLSSLLALASALAPGVLSEPIPKAGIMDSRQLVGALPTCFRQMQADLQPGFDFDVDACYNAPAVDASGKVNPGISPCDQIGSPAKGCREESYLREGNNNVYVRSRCNNGWCAILYGYYFETDAVNGDNDCQGHIHDWEHVVVWAEGDQVRYVSCSQHGGWDVRSSDDVLFDGAHPKIVYHKTAGTTHSMRFAMEEDDNPVENHTGAWFYGGLIDYYGFPSDDLRKAVTDTDWGKASPNIRDDGWAGVLDAAKGGNDIPLDVNVDDDGTTNSPC